MEFSTKEELMDHTRRHYENEGVLLTIKSSKDNRVVFKCDRGGVYSNVLSLTSESRMRKTHTRRTGCLFEVICTSLKGVWAVRKVMGTHNHDLSVNLGGHAVKRR